MVTTNIFHRVFRISHNGKTASAYTLEKGDSQYLVSAAHVFEGALEIPNVRIFHDGVWKTLAVQTVYNSLEVGDTIVFKLEFDISPRHHVHIGPGGIYVSGWAYFLGFPFGMFTEAGEINRKFPIPFVKAALISSLDSEREGLNVIYLDGHNNKGFSGGPVVCPEPNNPREMRIIGTVSGYLTENPIHRETRDDLVDQETNAGIIEAFWIRDLLDYL